MRPIPPSEPLHGHVRQSGVTTGPRKLALFKRALSLRGTTGMRSQEGIPDPVVYVKLFDPVSCWTFYVLEWDQQDHIFGYCIGLVPEFGYASLSELAQVRGRLSIGLELDVWFLPQRLSSAMS